MSGNKFNPLLHHRHSIRLKGYDYSLPGAYFITLVTQLRACLFGKIINNEIVLNPAGIMIERWWNELKHKFPHISTGAYAIMPNHFHGLIHIIDNSVRDVLRDDPHEAEKTIDNSVRVVLRDDPHEAEKTIDNSVRVVLRDDPLRDDPSTNNRFFPPLSSIIQWFKTMTTNNYIRSVKTDGWPPFSGKLWQRNYYEHIVRNQSELEKISLYITENPRHWIEDHENPEKLQ